MKAVAGRTGAGWSSGRCRAWARHRAARVRPRGKTLGRREQSGSASPGGGLRPALGFSYCRGSVRNSVFGPWWPDPVGPTVLGHCSSSVRTGRPELAGPARDPLPSRGTERFPRAVHGRGPLHRQGTGGQAQELTVVDVVARPLGLPSPSFRVRTTTRHSEHVMRDGRGAVNVPRDVTCYIPAGRLPSGSLGVRRGGFSGQEWVS